MEHVTKQTAIALENAGFPQPDKFPAGAFWYSPDCEHALTIAASYSNSCWTKDPEDVFAPNAIDMLQQMPSTIGRQIRLSFGGETFCVTVTETVDGMKSETYFFNKNAAEALAEAYLHLKENETPV
jgi:hypothetical protein